MEKVISPVNIEERSNLDIKAGDTVRLNLRIHEKGKTRLQPYEGLVIARKHGNQAGASITVRRVASGVGMEKTFPIYSPSIAKIELVKRAKTRRSKLYYIREKAAREARRKIKNIFGFERATVADDTVVKADFESKDGEAGEKIGNTIEDLINDKSFMTTLGYNIKKMAHSDSASKIADEIIKIIINKS